MNVLVRPQKPPAVARPALSSLGKQYVMAVTGLGLVLFVLAHMAGNLLLYGGKEALNVYAEGLAAHPGLLWLARSLLLIIFVVHIVVGIALTRQNTAARPVRYVYEQSIQARWAARHMLLTGFVLLAFVIYHLLHFTFGVTDPAHFAHTPIDPRMQRDVAGMVVAGFAQWPVAIGYIVAQVFLGLHLSHGAWSWFQHLGLNRPGYQRWSYGFALVVTLAVTLGNISIPLAILLGFRPA